MMVMKKSVSAVFLLLVLMACAKTSTTQPQPIDFRTGTQGLRMTFIPNLPPPKLFDREPFNVMIQIENLGTSTLQSPDAIYLSGFDPTIITGISTYGKPMPALDGRGPFMPQGGIDTVSFTATIASLSGRRIDKYAPTILATACYHYETVASAQVCIDPNPYAPTSVQRVCTPSAVSLGSQGAPIAITNVEVQPSPGKTRFKINIQNTGGGDVFKAGPQYLQKCNPYNPGLSFNEIDFVQLLDASVSGQSITTSCKPLDNDGHIRLTNGQASLFCETSDLLGNAPYITPLNIVLGYGYRQSISTNIEIRPIS